uniref:Uncharacterized protein K02A2.6-like n=1 Tax=Saccoglossus kowalevskii TaxID=10224 RepID=A0ABM0M1F1_SACKO|nr:PREDICTED: uncharacterized protein K02A2.6-like [Saccoglossus kowalevskii]
MRKEKPVAFTSRTLSPTERKYSTSEREALACVYASEHWHIVLYGRKYTLRTDHEALKSILSTVGSGHKPLRIYRWTDRLLQYNFDVEHMQGSKNFVADMLSRLVRTTDNTETENDILEINLDGLVTASELQTQSRDDPLLQRVATYVQNGWPKSVPPNLKVFANLRDELTVWNEYSIARSSRAVIPEALQERVLRMAHDGHPGIVRMKQRCRETVWWPGMDSQIEDYVRNCEPCAISGKSARPKQPPLQPTPWPTEPWNSIQMDIFGEIAIAPHSQRFLVVVHDLHSKWPEVATTGTVTSTAVIKILKELFTRWGFPEVITTDNGPQFTSEGV